MKSTVSVVIATFHGAQYVKGWSESLARQTYPIHEIIVIDNSLDQETYEEMQRVQAVRLRIFPQQRNLDFAQGYNLGMRKSVGEYVCILNQDLTLEPNAIEELVKYMDLHPNVAATSPALLRFGSSVHMPIIDSLGLSVSRNRLFRNHHEGEQIALPHAPVSVFGLTGAAMCIRRSALDALDAVTHEYFDPEFIAYKEDIDFSYRLRHLGYDLVVVPASVMYHKRTAQELLNVSLRESRRRKSYRIRGNSLKNQWWVLLKNEPWSTLILHAPWILATEIARLLFILCTEPSTLRILPTVLRQLPHMLRKRRATLLHSVISPHTLRLWIR